MSEVDVVLCIDGLDPGLVEVFKCKNVMQREYGSTDISGFELKSSPILWSSFAAGVNTEKYFLKGSKHRRKLYAVGRNLYLNLNNYLPRFLEEKLTPKLKDKADGFNTKKLDKNIYLETKKKPFFHDRNGCVVQNFPTYSYELVDRPELQEVLEDDVGFPKFKYKVKKGFDKRVNSLMEVLHEAKNSDSNALVVSYFDSVDLISHLRFSDEKVMGEVYTWIDSLVERVKESLGNSLGFCLIVSDHGMESLGRFGDHTDIGYGFYSVNRELGLDNPKITSLKNIVLKEVKKGVR